MRFPVVVLAFVLWVPTLAGQLGAGPGSQDLNAALSGDWTGVLEYRDYSEPPTSTKRVKLPAWLRVSVLGGALRFRYTFDDGPGKTVFSTSLVTVDAGRSTWTSIEEGKAGEGTAVDAVEGLERLKSGRGVLVLTGPGRENGQPVEMRTTVRIGRNLLEILRESRAAGAEFSFRDSYTMVRAQPPSPQ